MHFLVFDKTFCGGIFCRFKKNSAGNSGIPSFSDSLNKSLILKLFAFHRYAQIKRGIFFRNLVLKC
jgi:hypothetical protein